MTAWKELFMWQAAYTVKCSLEEKMLVFQAKLKEFYTTHQTKAEYCSMKLNGTEPDKPCSLDIVQITPEIL